MFHRERAGTEDVEDALGHLELCLEDMHGDALPFKVVDRLAAAGAWLTSIASNVKSNSVLLKLNDSIVAVLLSYCEPHWMARMAYVCKRMTRIVPIAVGIRARVLSLAVDGTLAARMQHTCFVTYSIMETCNLAMCVSRMDLQHRCAESQDCPHAPVGTASS